MTHIPFLPGSTLTQLAQSLLLPILLLPSALSAQSRTVEGDTLAALSLRAGRFQDLPAPQDTGQRIELVLVLDGASRTLELSPYELRAPGYRLLRYDGSRLEPVVATPPATYRGVVRGRARSMVAASLYEGRWTAVIQDGNGVWHVQPAPGTERSRHVVYRESDVAQQFVRCGVADTPTALSHSSRAGGGVGITATATHEVELALDADLEFYNRHGSNVALTQAAILQNVNAVDAIYQRDVKVRHRVTTIIVRQSRTYSQTNMSNLLTEFQNHWTWNHKNIVRDIAHLYTGKGTFSGVVGISNLGSLCASWGSYCASKAFSTNSALNTAVVAHEIAHTWAVPHCDSSPPCNIMCSIIGGCSGTYTSFGTNSGAIIRLQAITKKRPCVRKLITASYTYSGTGCSGSRGVPQLQASGRPVIGTWLVIGITGAGPGLPAAMNLGVSNTTWNGNSLPYDLGPLGAPGCFIRASGEYIQPLVTDASGNCSVGYPVPNTISVVGTRFYNQGFVYEPVNSLGVAVTVLGTALLGDL